jgi:hypothetical protein
MIADHMTGIEAFEAGLWKIADSLRANSNLASNEYFMPIMGLLFLRQATNRYYAALEAIEADRKAGKMADREPVAADFARRRALMLPKTARYDEILKTPKDGDLGAALIGAMEAIEASFPPLAGQLPKDYARFDGGVLENMMRTFDSEALRKAIRGAFALLLNSIEQRACHSPLQPSTRTFASWTTTGGFRAPRTHDRCFGTGFDQGDVGSPLEPIDGVATVARKARGGLAAELPTVREWPGRNVIALCRIARLRRSARSLRRALPSRA